MSIVGPKTLGHGERVGLNSPAFSRYCDHATIAMPHWLTASLLALCLGLGRMPLQAADLPLPALKISYAIGGTALAGDDDLWDRIRDGFSLDEANPQLVRVHERWFSTHSGHLQRAAERSRPYLYHIVEEVEKRGMPMEIALLPMIESAFNPMALSPRKASGIWQFIPSTGRIFGLDQNAWYDGRRDVVQATQAALDYLEKLYGMFGRWDLALAAYNCGEGCVQRAQKRSRNQDYAHLRLPNETRNYVPKLLAVRNVIRNPEAFGITLAPMANEPYFMPIKLKQPIEARTAAKLAEMRLDDLLALNPGFQRRVIHTDTQNMLLLPTDRLEIFQFNLHRQGLEKGSLQTYAAKKGESAAHIAAKFDVTVAWLKEHNPLRLWKGRLTQSQNLVVPRVMASKTAGKARLSQVQSDTSSTLRTHTVQKGETLTKLARLYDVDVAEIKRLNGIEDRIVPGMELDIPDTTG